MTTTGLSKRNLVVKKGVFRAGGRYKVEGCVWQGVCAGQLISFKCGPTSGEYHVQLIDGNFILYLVKLDPGCLSDMIFYLQEHKGLGCLSASHLAHKQPPSLYSDGGDI